MERHPSRLLVPYKAVGDVCSSVPPAFRVISRRRDESYVVCAIDNVVVQYCCRRLRLISVSNVLPAAVDVVAADSRYVYAAVGTRVAVLHLARQVERWMEVANPVLRLLPFGTVLVVVDVKSTLHVVDVLSGGQLLELELSSEQFQCSAVTHPVTYLNKILLGSRQGTLRIVNVKTGKLIHEFEKCFGAEITVLEQSPALDVVAVGLKNGQIILHNIKFDETIQVYKQDGAVTSIAFRTDGEDTMTTSSDSGSLAVWNLNKRSLLGQVTDAHRGFITGIHFLDGEPLMISAGCDNTLKIWISDMGHGMPRQLVLLEGHSKPITDVKFVDSDIVLSSGLDGSVRAFSLSRDTMRKKLGNAGIISRAKAKKKKRALESVELKPVIDMDIGFAREAAWDNVLCRHFDTALVTTWTTRKQALGTHRLLHKRFLNKPHLISAYASSICISSCGNFGIVGYTTGHIDCFNLQSGQHRKTFQCNKEDEKAHQSVVLGLALDVLNKQLVSAEQNGLLRFWDFRSVKLLAELQLPPPVVQFRMSSNNSLLAVGVGNGSIGVVDVLCRKVVRIISNAHRSPFTAFEFSPNSKWLISADEGGLIKVWDLITNSLIDVMKCKFYCISMCFSPNGEYLATCHQKQRSIYIWANKSLFISLSGLKAFPLDYLPENCLDLPVCRDIEGELQNECGRRESTVEVVIEAAKDVKQVESLLTLSGLAPPRWANLPYLDVIRERNKPIEPVKKPKVAPFFLPTVSTLDGFDFEITTEAESCTERRIMLMAKRNALEIESSFAHTLLNSTDDIDFISAFDSLKWMNISSIDFQIRILPEKALSSFLKMLLTLLRSRQDYELVQSYLAAFLKVHRSKLWYNCESSDLDNVLFEIRDELYNSWKEVDKILQQNASVIKWIKSALI